MQNVAVIDCGLCNLDSVVRAVEKLGSTAVCTYDAGDIGNATHMILPGVGAFPDAMSNIRERGIDTILRKRVDAGVPLLGICLGMQLLASKGYEGRETEGLGYIPGAVRRLLPVDGARIPHVGWNEVHEKQSSPLFTDLASGQDFYFVHSFHLIPEHAGDILAVTPYCGEFVSVVGHGNVFGTQFHPEKSQKPGFALLSNFLAMHHA